MPFYPVNLNLAGKHCVILGGGTVAERKVLPLLVAEAKVTVISPQVTPRLADLAEARRIIHIARHYREGDLRDVFLAICATDNSKVNRQAAQEAARQKALVNVVDNPDLGNFSVPAQVKRGDLLITVSTGGKTPAMAKRLREELAAVYGPEYELYIDLLARLRGSMKKRLATAKERETFWRQNLDKEILDLLRLGKIKEAEDKIKNAIGSTGAES